MATTINFPIDKPPTTPYDLQEEDILLRSPTDGPYTITRKKYTKARMMPMTFKWQYMTNAEYVILMDFYRNTIGSGSLSFNFSIVMEELILTYEVLLQKPPKTTYVGMGLWEIELTFEEVIDF